MKRTSHKNLVGLGLSFALIFLSVSVLNAQTYNAYSGGYSTGYGTVYGSLGLAMATQNLYNTSQIQMQKLMARQAMINKWGRAAVEKAEREVFRQIEGKQIHFIENDHVLVCVQSLRNPMANSNTTSA